MYSENYAMEMSNTLNKLCEFVGLKHNVHRYIKRIVRNLKDSWEKAMGEFGLTNQCTAIAGQLQTPTVTPLRRVPIVTKRIERATQSSPKWKVVKGVKMGRERMEDTGANV